MSEQGKPAPSWDEYFKAKQDVLNRNLGRMEATERGKYDPRTWDIYIVGICQDLLQLIGRAREGDVKLETQIQQVEAKLDKIAGLHLKYIDKKNAEVEAKLTTYRDQVTDMAGKLKTWMEKYQRLLDIVADDYRDKLDRVHDLDHQ